MKTPTTTVFFSMLRANNEKGSVEFNPSFTTSIIEVEGEELKVDDDYDWELDSVVVEPYTDEGDENDTLLKLPLVR